MSDRSGGRMGQPRCSLALFLLLALLPGTARLSAAAVAADDAAAVRGGGNGGAAEQPGLETFVPKATEVRERLARLEDDLPAMFDRAAWEETLAGIAGRTSELETRANEMRSGGRYGYEQLLMLREALQDVAGDLESRMAGLSETLADLEARRKEWGGITATWGTQPRPDSGEVLPAIGQAVKEIRGAAGTALKELESSAKLVVDAQHAAGVARGRVIALQNTVDKMFSALRTDTVRKTDPAVFSSEFLGLFKKGLAGDLFRGLAAVRLPGWDFLVAQRFFLLLHAALFTILAMLLLHVRTSPAESPAWKLVAERPVSSSLFLATVSVAPLYRESPPSWVLLLTAITAVSGFVLFVRFVGKTGVSRVVLALLGAHMALVFFRLVDVPLPLLRIFLMTVSLAGGLFCLALATVAGGAKPANVPAAWALRAGAALFGAVLLAELMGYGGLGTYLFEAATRTVLVVLAGRLIVFLVQGCVEFVVRGSTLGRLAPVQQSSAKIVGRTVLFAGLVTGVLGLALLATIWRLYDTPADALGGLFGLGFTLGGQRIDAGMLMGAVVALYASLVVSWILQSFLMETVYQHRRVEQGARHSVNRLIHYALALAGFLLALGILGVELRNITILAGAFGIGIGFGLQNVVNNFVGGLILLFEQPVKVGDIIQIGQDWGTIRKLGLRATVVETFDQSEIIVPNSDLISNQVTNWTLSDRASRVIMPVGVAYGSDVPLVMRILGETADAHPLVLKRPPRQVYFMGFGNSSLDFELRVWIGDIEKRFDVRSDLNEAIDRRFRESGVEIPFPQRDLHLRSIDGKAARMFPGERSAPDGGRGSEETGQEEAG